MKKIISLISVLLIMLSLLTQSITNASFGIYFPRFAGTIYEILSAPVSPFEIVLESPHHAPVDLQRTAYVLALTEILREYRRLFSYAANI